MIAAWSFAEYFWNILTVGVGAVVSLFAVFVLVRVVEPQGLTHLIRNRRRSR